MATANTEPVVIYLISLRSTSLTAVNVQPMVHLKTVYYWEFWSLCHVLIKYVSVQSLNTDGVSYFSSSISTTSSVPARQEVTSGAGVRGNWCSGAAGLSTPVEQWTTSLSGVHFFYTARLQAAWVQKPNTPSAPPAKCTSGRASPFINISVGYVDSKGCSGIM